MQEIHVALKERAYTVYVEAGILDRAGEYLRAVCKATRVAIITDDNVAPLYLSRVAASLEKTGLEVCTLTLHHGEETKSLTMLQKVYSFLCENRLTRRDCLVALGGGVIGDLTGLAAATYLRGIDFVQIPTTLLAQVDSSVGGKVAVDLPEGKNLVGAFYQPKVVLCDPKTLETLTDHFWRDGLGEVVKYGCISDEPLFALLEKSSGGGRTGVMGEMETILERCISAKARVVEQDERDTGLRMTLNFGHTIAHAIEKCQYYTGLSHGAAVAVGMAYITRLSESMGMTEKGSADRLIELEKALGLETEVSGLAEEELIAAMGMDKKNLGKTLNVILLEKIGTCFIHPASQDFFRGFLGK